MARKKLILAKTIKTIEISTNSYKISPKNIMQNMMNTVNNNVLHI